MPQTCVVINCHSFGNDVGRRFYRFPMICNKSNKTLATSISRQQSWLTALNRSDFFEHEYKHARVCDLHFISGRSANLMDVDNPDWVPSLNLGYVDLDVTNNENIDLNDARLEVIQEVRDESEPQLEVDEVAVDDDSAEVTIDLHKRDKQTQTKIQTSSVGVQTDGTITGMSADITITNKERIAYLEEMLLAANVQMESFRGDDRKTNFFTGISCFDTFESLFQLLENDLPSGWKLTKFQIFFIVLKRLRLNVSFRYLSYQFNVAITTISKSFHKGLHVLYSKLKSLVYWPDSESIKRTMPLAFQRQFGKSIVVVIDCFEIFIEKPSSLKAAAQCWSNYKHAYTIKYLIGISPQGFIQFISKGYGGRSSDKFITEECGFLKHLQVGDVVMADRGFLIEEALHNRGVELSIPAFTKGKSQLHPLELEETRNIANVRIHVERVIGQLRLKFPILRQQKFPITLIAKPVFPHVSTIDQIVTVCCALSNLCTPIVCKVESEETL